MLTVTRISHLTGLEALSAEWSALVERVPEAAPFQRPEWLIPWWKWFGSGELHALAFHSRERLAGFLPLFTHEWNGGRQVTIAGTGISDRLGLLAEEPFAGHCARHVWAYLKTREEEWNLCDWQDLSAESPLAQHAERWFDYENAASPPWMRVQLPATPAEYEASLSSELRRDLRRFTRKLEREGHLRFETVTGDVWLLGRLFELHQERWSAKGGPASHVDRLETQQFIFEMSRRMDGAGKFRLYVMWHCGAPVGMILALMDRRVAWDLITGMDPALMKYSPGSLLLKYSICDAIREGAHAWDFLRGQEQYKFRWGAKLIPTTRLLVSSRAAEMPVAASPAVKRRAS
jgi:CelD/BcsL family acetyltransferase involved in cellulose biosynthesis